MDAELFFATEWAGLVPMLRSVLARAGASVADRDDLVQETAMRLLAAWDSVDYDRGVAPLARQIALNAWRDQWRRRGRHEVIGELPERADTMDTERVAMGKLRVAEVAHALTTLPAPTVSVLRAAAGEAEGVPAAPASAALRMARSRARRALSACAQVACAVVAVVVRGLTRPAKTSVAMGAVAVAAVAFSTSAGGPVHAPAQWRALPPAADMVATGRHVATPAMSTRALRPAPKAAHKVRAHPDPPYYYIGSGPATAGVFADVGVNGYGVAVSRPQPGDDKPVCVYGSTPGLPAVSRCAS